MDVDDQDDQDDHPQVDEAKKSATKSEAQPSQIAVCPLEYLAANCVLFVCLFVCYLLRQKLQGMQKIKDFMQIHKHTLQLG